MKRKFIIFLAAILLAVVTFFSGAVLGRLYAIHTSTLLECSDHHAAINFNGNEVYYAN